MEELRRLLQEVLTFDLIQAVISAPRKKEGACKIKIRPVILRDELVFQASLQEEKKVFHKNYDKEELTEAVVGWMTEQFGQLQMELTGERITVLASRKGKVTVRRKKTAACTGRDLQELSHNRKKRYILEEGRAVPFLVDLGVMTPDGKIIKAKYDKYRQINRFLEFIEDVLPRLPKGREVTIVDFGCGKSYLTFAMYYYLKELKDYDIRIIGLDLKEDVIERCRRLGESYGYEKLEFCIGDIASYTGLAKVDMVVTLHACDTATDYALHKAVAWGASVILSVPCCQHECNGQIESEVLGPVLKYGLIRERMAALFTDAMRANLLEQQGYQVQMLEFIDMEHTPKNILIRAVRKTGQPEKRYVPKALEERTEAGMEPGSRTEAAAEPESRSAAGTYEALREFLHVDLTLDRLLREEDRGQKERK